MGAKLMEQSRVAHAGFGQRSVAHGPLWARHRPLPADAAALSAADVTNLAGKLRAAPAGATATAKPLTGFQRFWRDFGVNPLAMLKRAFVDPPAAQGSALRGGVKAEGALMDNLRADLKTAVDRIPSDGQGGLTNAGLDQFKGQFKEIAARYGVNVVFKTGAPTVAWGDVPTLEVMGTGGLTDAHEMVHAVQTAIGGVAALSTAARDKVTREKGRPPRDDDEVRAAVATLTPAEREAAFAAIVQPMETQAYARFEETAFQATGMFGKRAKDVERYKAGLKDNVDAFCDAYLLAAVPRMETAGDARVYGTVGHLARTHGETAVILTGAGVAYKVVAAAALALNPVAGAVALAPLAYLLYRSVVG
jgi:hypothetical protein